MSAINCLYLLIALRASQRGGYWLPRPSLP